MAKLNNVNTTDIAEAIRFGCNTMCSVFNADDNNVPFFASEVWPHGSFAFSPHCSESHVPGRHLNALLNAEDALGIAIDTVAIDHHANAAFLSYSGPLCLPLNRKEMGGAFGTFCPHHIREGFHALYALVKYRKSDRAQDIAEKSIDCILALWDPVNGWNREVFEKQHVEFTEWSFVIGLGRSLGSLVKYYNATGSARALHLATMIKDKLINEFYGINGNFDASFFGDHVHSVTCCLSSLAQMAELMGDLHLMNRVKVFYDNGLWQLRDEIGWSPEFTHQISTKLTEHGEANNTGDIIETAMILARCGYTEYYDDAERILRAHLLPSQLRDISFIKEPENPKGLDSLYNIAQRHKGAWGFPAPYGHKSINAGRNGSISFNMDIVGGVVGSLCEAYREIAFLDHLGHHVNLLFDYDTPNIHIESPYTHETLKIHLHRSGPLFVRIPFWVDCKQLQIDGVRTQPLCTGNKLFFPQISDNCAVTIRFPMPQQTITMKRNHIFPIKVKLQGDKVLAMDNFGADFTFFDPIE
ncbi:MAG: hypothetical protein ACYC54_07445 [Sedimentisphaerales bacterium]